MVLESKCQAIVEDRISALPDALIRHILSFLKTKYAVRTTILSPRWKDIWKSVPVLDFNDYEDFCTAEIGYYGSDRFMTLVNRVLFFRGSSDIQKFQLQMSNGPNVSRLDDLSRLDGWIRTAIKHNLVELDLTLYFKTSDELRSRKNKRFEFPLSLFMCKTLQVLKERVFRPTKKRFEFPQSLFMCKTLQVLKVCSNCITYNPPTSGCFPCLKILQATILEYPDNNFKLFSHCPVLESLTINGTLRIGQVLNFNISAPKLRNLSVSLDVEDGDGIAQNFYIDAPKLENLDLVLDGYSNYTFKSVNSLVQANFTVFSSSETDANRATALLALISHVKYLSLKIHGYHLKACHLPALNNLKQLKLDCSMYGRCVYTFVLEVLLKRSPNLEDLVLEDDSVCKVTFSEQQWNPLESVPICLLSHLKTISIKGFEGCQIEKEVAKYLLKNGKVLNKMTFYTPMTSLTGLEESYNEFLMFPRGSGTCQVQFIKM